MSERENAMSDEQHEAKDECLYPMVCVYHAVQNAKVRAVKIDGETYVNTTDLTHWLKVLREFEHKGMADEIAGMPPALQTHMQAATMNHVQGMLHTEERVLQVGQEDILPMTDARGLLVAPDEFVAEIPDVVPTSWQEQEH
jgi:hypothetical protein